MIKLITLIRRHLDRLYVFRFTGIILFFLSTAAWLIWSLSSLYLSLSLSTVLLAGSFRLIFFIKRQREKDLNGLVRRTELALLGKRRLILDAVLELDSRGQRDGLSEEYCSMLEGQAGFQGLKEGFQRSSTRQKRGYLGLILVLSLAGLMSGIMMSGVVTEIRTFFRQDTDFIIPSYYHESRDWEWDLSPYLGLADRLEVQADAHIIESDKGIFLIPARLTGRPHLDIVVTAYKRGLKKVLYSGRIPQLQNFLPLNIAIAVRYPYGTEHYTGLQDLELWAGARLSIQGEMNYFVSNVYLKGASGTSSVEESRFWISSRIGKAGTLSLEVQGVEGLRYNSPPFAVKVLPNAAPRLSILFPPKDVILSHHQWRVLSLIEGEDDQGIKRLAYTVIVTNKDPYLAFSQKRQQEFIFDHPRFLRHELEFRYTDWEMLPGDVAAIHIRLQDSLGKWSETQGFFIISPDIWQLQQQDQQLRQSLKQDSLHIQEQLRKLEQDVVQDNLSGAEQKAKDIKQTTEDLERATQDLHQHTQDLEAEIQEVQKSLKRMEEISSKLKQYSEMMQDMQQWMQPEQRPQLTETTKSMEQMLQEFESLLDNLEHYKKYTNMARQFEILEQSYQQLKQSDNSEQFRRNLKNYKKQLEQMEDMAVPRMQQTIQGLKKESDQLKQGETQTFRESDQKMRELSQQVRESLNNAGRERMEQRKQELERVIHELYLDQVFLEKIRGLDTGKPGKYDLEVVSTIVEHANALRASLSDSSERLESALAGLVFTDPRALQAIRDLLNRNRELLDLLSQSLRDNRMNEVQAGLSHSANHLSLLFYQVLKISRAMDDLMQQMQSQQGSQQMSLSMEQLMQMQGQMSRSLQQLLQQMQQGGMSPQMQEMMDQMSRLQSEIRKNLSQAMRQGQEGLMSEGQETFSLMDDIIKDLKSYKVDTDTLEKSKKIEQKMLKARKSLQSKGISEKRKAQSAKKYSVEIVPDLKDESTLQWDLDSIQEKQLDSYYLELIKKYKQQFR